MPTSDDRLLVLVNQNYTHAGLDLQESASNRRAALRLETYIEQAQIADEAGIDALFHADFSGLNRTQLRTRMHSAPFDPFQLAAILALHTSRIRLVPTASTLFMHPYRFTTALASLDRISEGRAGINVVSSAVAGATGVGMPHTLTEAQRQAQQREFVQLSQALWETWPPASYRPDDLRAPLFRDELITDVHHRGDYYEYDGPIDRPPYSTDYPWLISPARSGAGIVSVAATADALFAGAPTPWSARELTRFLRTVALSHGRRADAVKLIIGARIDLAGSHPSGANPELTLSDDELLQSWPAAEKRYPFLERRGRRLDDPAPRDEAPDPQEAIATYGSDVLPIIELLHSEDASFRDILHLIGQGTRRYHATFSGSADEIVAQIAALYEQRSIDGININGGNDFARFAAEIAPRLRKLARAR